MADLLNATAITKSFAGVHALRDVSFELSEGEVHALIGENGAGKSTFTKDCYRHIEARFGSAADPRSRGHREQSKAGTLVRSCRNLSTASSLPPSDGGGEHRSSFESGASGWKVNWKSRYARADELLHRLGISLDCRRLAGSLSMAEQQIVEIAKAIGFDAKILFMDEPTALLTDREVENLFRLVRQLRAEGVGIVYISHRLEEIQSLADRITILRDGLFHRL